MRRFASYLGDEVVVALTADRNGKTGEPLFLAEAAKPGLREFFDSEMERMGPAKMRFEMRGNVAIVSPQASALAAVQGGFASTPFFARIQDAYRDGAGLLLAADVSRLAPFRGERELERAGFANVKYLVVEQRDLARKSDTRALVTFSGERTGITSWLASPAPMGSLDFVSPDAAFATAFALKSPASALNDIFQFAQGSDREFDQHLAEVESKLGVSLKNDIAAALGSDIAFAVDGAALPTPSWKLVVEVNDPARLQAAIERMAQSVELGKKLALDREQAGQRTWYTLRAPGGGPLMEAHYTFVDGYLVAAPNRALLDRAIQYRATGYTLARSETFAALLPRDRQSNFSAIVYQNAGGLLGAAADTLGGVQLTPDQRKSLEKLAAESKPSLIYAYAGDDRIQVASSGGVFGLSLADLAGARSPAGAMRLLKR